MTVYFAPQAIPFERLAGGRAIYRVQLPQLRYDGRVLIATARHHGGGAPDWIAGRLDALAADLGYPVTCGRLYSPLDLEDPGLPG
jgi:hypothetical protein